jgi:hypothetical protein
MEWYINTGILIWLLVEPTGSTCRLSIFVCKWKPASKRQQ